MIPTYLLQDGEVQAPFPIDDLKHVYSITSHGRVYSSVSGIFLKLYTKENGESNYVVIGTITYNHKRHRFIVHRLVAKAFIANPDNLSDVIHINGDGTNNKVSNLKWNSRVGCIVHHIVRRGTIGQKSQFHGVSMAINGYNAERPWIVRVKVDGRRIFSGSYLSEVSAAKAYNDFVVAKRLNRPLNNLEMIGY